MPVMIIKIRPIRTSMKLSIVLLTYLYLIPAYAGISILIEHPRYPANDSDVYRVECLNKCKIDVSALESGVRTVEPKILQEKISKIFNAGQDGIPMPAKESHRYLYRIKISEGSKKADFTLNYPLAYVGDEYVKYANLINLIEDLKRDLKKEIGSKQ